MAEAPRISGKRGASNTYSLIFVAPPKTKPITGVALMTLYEQGLLDLNDPLHKFLPGFRDLSVRLPDGELIPSNQGTSPSTT
ncbi:MAG: beta-lactamase family protein [Oscillochloris sp.]|nr:beta-lactamase family protein [Oscillochloris sp.]